MLKITNITEVKEANRKITQESLQKILKNSKMLENYLGMKKLTDIIEYIIDDFEEEVKIDTFHDINDYIEYFIEMIRES